MTMAKLILKSYPKVLTIKMKLFACWKICLIFMHLCGCVYLGVYDVCIGICRGAGFSGARGPSSYKTTLAGAGNCTEI